MAEFPWKRVWSNVNAMYELDRDGFLPERVGERSEFWRPLPSATWLDQLDHVRCLVLLGEPGMGKSHEISLERERLGRRDDVLMLWRDLRDGPVEAELSEALEGQLRSCLDAPKKGVFLLVDSLDVVEHGVVGTVRHICRMLSNLDAAERGRVSLRLACRSSDWATALDTPLRKAFGGAPGGPIGFACYKLEPLRGRDVEGAATIRGLAAEEFLQGLRRTRTQGLAAVPVTLELLLRRAARGLDPGEDPVALYRDAMRQLCREHDATREGALDLRRATPERLSELAEHVAAFVTIVGATIRDGAGADGEPVESLSVYDLSRGVTMREGPPREVPEPAVRALLRTALFTHRRGGVQFAHRTYQEFLAAECLLTRGLDVEGIRRLLTDGDAVAPRIAPHLRGTAAWCAAMSPAFAKLIADDEPAVLLRGGVRHLPDDASRERVTRGLLAAVGGGRLALAYQEAACLDELAYPGLEAQLHRYLTDPETPHNVWQVALAVARKCSVRLPFGELAQVALDPRVPDAHRVNAAELLIDAAPVNVRRPLHAVLREPGLCDRLRGAVLHALWPDALSAEELAESLVPPRDPRVITTNDYSSFVNNRLFERLAPEHLPTLLRKAATFETIEWLGILDRLTSGLMQFAWASGLEREDVARGLSEVLATRLTALAGQAEEFFISPPVHRGELPSGKDHWAALTRDKRRRVIAGVVETFVSRATNDDVALKAFDILLLCDWPYVFLDDRPWVAAQETSSPTGRLWGLLRGRIEERSELAAAMYRGSSGDGDWLRTIREKLPWVHRARSLRSVAPDEAAAGRTPAKPPTPAPRPTDGERRCAFDALRASVLAALGRTRLPLRGDLDLLEAVIASVRRLERRLQGETPLAFALWNEAPGNRCRPKSEDDLSDFVRDHLLTDLREVAVVVAREPEVDRGAGYLDLDVKVTDGCRTIARVVVEVKATWNRDLVGALESQLVGRYMRKVGARCGLYLVGDFSSPYWDQDDERRGEARRGSKRVPELVAAAEAVSRRHGVRAAVLAINCSLDRLRRVPEAPRIP